MIYVSTEPKTQPGTVDKTVYKVSAATIPQFWDLLQWLQGHGEGWWGRWPSKGRGWEHNDKRQPCFFLSGELLARLTSERKVAELPGPYAELQLTILRRELWKELWHDHKSNVAGGVSEYWRKKLVYLSGAAKKSGDHFRDPTLYSGRGLADLPSSVELIENTNSWIENFDLGQRKRVNPRNAKGGWLTLEYEDEDPMLVFHWESDEYDVEEVFSEYLLSGHAHRAGMLTARPELAAVLDQWDRLRISGKIQEALENRVVGSGSGVYPYGQ